MTKVKKWLLFSALSILALSLIQGVSSYSSANIRSPATVRIVDPGDALIAIPDGQTIDVSQGNTTSKLKIKNNMADIISVNAVGKYSDGNKDFTISGTTSLDPGSPVSSDPEFQVDIAVATGTITGTVPVEVTFTATWNGGRTVIKSTVNVIGAAQIAGVKLSAPVTPKQGLTNPVSKETAKPTAPTAEDSKDVLTNPVSVEPDKPIIEEVPITQVTEESNTYPSEKPPVQELPISPQQEIPVNPSGVQGDAQIHGPSSEPALSLQNAPASGQEKSQIQEGVVQEQPSNTSQPVGAATVNSTQQGAQPLADIVQGQSSTNTPQPVEGAVTSSGQGNIPAQGQTIAPVSVYEKRQTLVREVSDT